MLRTLTYYWPVTLAVVAGAAVATAVLTGALLVGDSVRGSLRALTLDRLGGIDQALVAERFFRESLAVDIPGSVPAILMRGSARRPDSGALAGRVAILGVDSRFTRLHTPGVSLDLSRKAKQIFPSVVLNESLRRELDLEIGDPLILRFGSLSAIPRETLMGEKDPDDVLASIRLTLTGVLPDRGLGRFGLAASQQVPRNAFVALEVLQRSLHVPGRVNALFTGVFDPDPGSSLRAAVGLEDLGLVVRDGEGFVEIGSREFVLRPEIDAAVGEVAEALKRPILRTQSYLATALEFGDREVPYALVNALDPLPGRPWASLQFVDGSPVTTYSDSGLLVNRWVAEDLGVTVGDPIVMRYFVVGAGEELREESATFRVDGIVEMVGLGADRSLTPEYPGIQEARDMSDWDPPFPVDLRRIRPADEDYWDRFGATPKAFVSSETGRRLWATRYGSTTAVRLGDLVVDTTGTLEELLREGLLARVAPEEVGLVFRPIRRQGLDAAVGATDFAGLFAAFSMFLILSAAMLVGLLFRLGVEQRAREIGLRLAVGYRVGWVRRTLQVEGVLLAGVGGVFGVVAGVGYAWLLMAGLRTIWRPAVGSSELYLHGTAQSVVLGWLAAVVVVVVSVRLALRKLVRIPAPALLAGTIRPTRPARRGRLSLVVTLVGLMAALASSSVALATDRVSSPALAFATGAALLLTGLAAFAAWCGRKRPGPRIGGVGRILAMAGRNSAWNPGRSILSVSLMACACFVIVMVAANRAETRSGTDARESGAGGFSLVAEVDVPLHQDLNNEDDRFDLGFSARDSSLLDRADVMAFRSRAGDDASCLNLYRPGEPRLLGANPRFVRRGGFSFQQHLDLPPDETNPWMLLERPLEPGVVPAIGDYNSVLWILHLGLGDELTIEDERGRPLRLRIVGMLAESIFQSELLISESNFVKHFPTSSGQGFLLVDARENEDDVARILESTLADYGLDATTAESRIAGFKVVQNTYLSTFQLLGGLGLLLGTVGLGIVLVRNVIERRGELAALRSFGFRRTLLARIILTENALLLLVGMGVGTFAALAATAPRLAGRHMPWDSLAVTLAIVALVGMLSSVLAVAATLRVPLLSALKADR